MSIIRDSRIYGAQTSLVCLKQSAVKRAAGVANVSKQIFMRVKLFCAFRSRHPHPWLYTPLPIDTHLYFYHHPTAPTAGIVYDTIRLIISCLYATIDRTANCTRHSDSKTVPPRALLQPSRSKTGFFFPSVYLNRRNWFYWTLHWTRLLLFVILVLYGRLFERHLKSAPWIRLSLFIDATILCTIEIRFPKLSGSKYNVCVRICCAIISKNKGVIKRHFTTPITNSSCQ